MKPMIRPALPQDAAALSAAFAHAYAEAAATIPDLPDMATGIAGDIAAHHVWLAEQDGICIGGLVVSLTPPTAHLMNIALTKKARGTGLGRALIETAVTAAENAACSRIDLATHRMMPQNIPLYEKFGWSITGQEGNKVFMSRALGRN